MRHKIHYFFTILLPGFSMFFIEEYIVGLLCMLLQMTLLGWPIASIWAYKTLQKYYRKQKHIKHQEAQHDQ